MKHSHQNTDASVERLGSGESQLETGISYLLVAGVVISLVLEIIGIVLFYRTYGNLAASQSADFFLNGKNFFSFAVQQIRAGEAPAALRFLTAGVIVLILTPYVRLVASVFYFGWEKNWKYVVITLYVAIVVTVSLALH